MTAAPAPAATFDVDIRLDVADGTRRFHLDVRFRSDADVLALYGPSGAGKSMTLQAVAGLRRPDAGHVRVAGRTLFDGAAGIDLPAARRGVGYLFQEHALFPYLTVRQNIGFGLTRWWRPRLRADQAERVDALLESFGLQAQADARPAQLSGGQRQRVALARALANDPAMLLLDEPFSALNPSLRASLRDEIATARARWGIPMLLITHDIDDVAALADEARVIEGGSVVREVDLKRGESRETVREALAAPLPPVADAARRRGLRQLLGLPAVAPAASAPAGGVASAA